MTERRKIVFISHNVSGNCMYRTLLLYRALEPFYDVEIVGFDRGAGVWPPIRGENITLRYFTYSGWFSFLRSAWRLLRTTRADLVIASKVRLPSYGLALFNRFFRGTPVIVDVDDDELSMTRPPETARWRTVLAFSLKNPDAYYTTLAMHRLMRRADHVFCVSRHFQQLYGGSIVPHGLRPHGTGLDRAKIERLKASLGIEDSFVVVFVGTPRAHKGVGETLEAARLSGIDRIKVVVVGAAAGDRYAESLQHAYPGLFVPVPPVPSTEIPYYLAVGDVTVLAQKDLPESRGQMPAKLTDAMFSGLPVIATALADIPVYLEGCGILIPDSAPQTIAEALRWVANNPEEARELGEKGRAVAQARLTDQAIAATMVGVISARLADGGSLVSAR